VIKLTDPDAFAKLTEVEGERWAEYDKRGGICTFTTMLAEYNDHVRRGFLPEEFEPGTWKDHVGVIYGEGGWSRYAFRRGSLELVLLGNTTHNKKCAAAMRAGFKVLL
jgi:hypothetical protein